MCITRSNTTALLLNSYLRGRRESFSCFYTWHVDRRDLRPLIVDQPEENLDPQSVFQELVPHFRETRKRRQVIIVTHNASLVVNTDADQVIVATSVATADGALPTISYESGSLENGNIRKLRVRSCRRVA